MLLEISFKLRRLAQGDINPRSTTGNVVVDYGTEKLEENKI